MSIPRCLLGTLCLVAFAVAFVMLPARETHAENGGLPGFLQNLFGGFSSRPERSVPSEPPLRARSHKQQPRKKSDDYLSSTATRAPGAPGGAPIKPKAFVTVMGDSLGLLVGQGLASALSDRPEMSVSNLARDLSGLTRDDYFDWPEAARRVASGTSKTNVVVILLGINDLQPLRSADGALDPLSESWRAAYGARVQAMVTPLVAAHIPVLWVGLPPMLDEKFNAQAIALNEIFRERSQEAGAKYIDIWDAFADSEGKFTYFGADAEGQNAKLRTGANGVYFTKAGSRKIGQLLAGEIRHFVEKPASSDEIATLPPDIEEEADSINEQIRRETAAEASNPAGAPAFAVRRAGPILSLGARPISPQGQLISLDGANIPVAREPLPEGQFSSSRGGRSDDFRWPRPN